MILVLLEKRRRLSSAKQMESSARCTANCKQMDAVSDAEQKRLQRVQRAQQTAIYGAQQELCRLYELISESQLIVRASSQRLDLLCRGQQQARGVEGL